MVAVSVESVFHVRSVTKVYQMGEVQVHALRGVELDLFPGEFVVILGASGSGKSTLLNILGGLDTPTSGSVTFRDHDLSGADEDERTRYRREHVGFVFQFYNLIAGLTALENVSLVAEISPDPLEPSQALELVGLRDRVQSSKAELAQVAIGASNGLETEIREGLEQGDLVILHPTDQVRSGIRISGPVKK